MFNSIRIWPYRHLIVYKAWADFRKESERTFLGVLWFVLDPVISIFIYYVVFGIIFRKGDHDFMAVLTVGIVTFNWFRAGVAGAANSIQANVGFVRQVSFQKLVFPLSTVLMVTYQFGFALLVQFCVLFLYGFYPTEYWLLYPLVLFAGLALTLAVGLPLAAVVPFVPDLNSIINYVLRFVFFLSCVMYQLHDLSPSLQKLILLNPIVHLINGARDVLLYRSVGSLDSLAVVAAISTAVAIAGAWFIARFDLVYAKRMM